MTQGSKTEWCQWLPDSFSMIVSREIIGSQEFNLVGHARLLSIRWRSWGIIHRESPSLRPYMSWVILCLWGEDGNVSASLKWEIAIVMFLPKLICILLYFWLLFHDQTYILKVVSIQQEKRTTIIVFFNHHVFVKLGALGLVSFHRTSLLHLRLTGQTFTPAWQVGDMRGEALSLQCLAKVPVS